MTHVSRSIGLNVFMLRVHLKDISHLDDVLDKVLAYAQTTTSIIRSTPVPLRNLPVGESR
jgi:Lrp/AsnC family transcriptional regulator, leucine-responsive regulatory protein